VWGFGRFVHDGDFPGVAEGKPYISGWCMSTAKNYVRLIKVRKKIEMKKCD
jgi:hypothetical protein